ncbi:fibronectin type III domain-containing protein [Leptospira ilyithenensis]|uniref:Fibronectin type III domain-containing protein n=1 Tax=Leptospira ilyithenensis TaxID=2484901 RepID=A0A4R9LM25_9LEPT|nr:fibronectin type III domain-containing protein [Leptospira ilyithenensis]TGN09106.1 fibronectin type III domain-containing protein [Leptospira ilyithenensis]
MTGLTSGTLYYVRVEARNGVGGVSLLSQEQTVFTTSVPPGTAVSGTYADISAGQGINSSGGYSAAIIDSKSDKLLVITANQANNNKSSLFRCNLDGSNCTHTDISAGQGSMVGFTLSVTFDLLSSKLLVVAGVNLPGLYRCNLDGTNCIYTDISSAQPAGSGGLPFALIDPTSGKLLTVALNSANNEYKPSLFMW